MRIEEITRLSFAEHALDGFVRHQEVRECWRRSNGEWSLQPICFTETWDEAKLREMEQDVLATLAHGFGYMALEGDAVIGFALVDAAPIGPRGEYRELTDFQVSEPYRNRGIGKKLFGLAAGRARAQGAEKLYISAHSSRESQAAYRSIGCVHATWVYDKKAQAEPYDVQMEYILCGRAPEQNREDEKSSNKGRRKEQRK